MCAVAAAEIMTRTPTQLEEWTEPLSVFSPGMSLADLVLISPKPSNVVFSNPTWTSLYHRSLNTIPDSIQGGLDTQVFYFLTSRGLDKTLSIKVAPDPGAEDLVGWETAIELRNESGLSIDALARLAGVSRVTYHKWLNGSGMSQDNAHRLKELLITFQTLGNILGEKLSDFLEQTGGLEKPIDLLGKGDFAAVIGMALRPLSSPMAQRANVIRQESDLPSWLPTRSLLAWNGPRISETELDEALGQISPAPYIEPSQADESTSEHDQSVYKVSGFYLE